MEISQIAMLIVDDDVHDGVPHLPNTSRMEINFPSKIYTKRVTEGTFWVRPN